jgi:hypothetical protein
MIRNYHYQNQYLLNYILTEHDKNIDEYNEKNDVVLQRYHIDNEEVIKNI